MIDCLSNPDWINAQTDFLLLLQNIRIETLDIFDKFFLSITMFGELCIPTIICAIIFWCIDAKTGVYLFSLEGFNLLLSHFLKMVACVYRPWVLDNRIHPSELAVPAAKGYSFPSGHTAMSSTVFGGIALILKNRKIIVFMLLALIALVGFSRLWLGVHTPQDVLGGLFIGVFLIFFSKPLVDWAETNKNRYLYLVSIINILALLSFVYLYFFNSFRTDYIDGNLLVNPQHSIFLTIVIYGCSLGLINGCYLERKFISHNPKDFSLKSKIIISLIGTISIIFAFKYIVSYLFAHAISGYIAFLVAFLIGFSITLIYPSIFTHIFRNK